jgi:hypothetical protein
MSLLTTLQHHTRLAYRALNGVLQPGVWVQRGEGVYDPATGEVVEPEPVRVPVSVLVSSYPREEVDGVRILASDKRLCVMQALPSDVPPASPQVPLGLTLEPTLRDDIEIGGKVWQIITLEEDAARLTWQVQGRSEGEG